LSTSHQLQPAAIHCRKIVGIGAYGKGRRRYAVLILPDDTKPHPYVVAMESDARAEGRSEHVSMEGAEGMDSAGGAPNPFFPPVASAHSCFDGVAIQQRVTTPLSVSWSENTSIKCSMPEGKAYGLHARQIRRRVPLHAQVRVRSGGARHSGRKLQALGYVLRHFSALCYDLSAEKAFPLDNSSGGYGKDK
jgi:hypothetical protein